jgi:hypothetical protein
MFLLQRIVLSLLLDNALIRPKDEGGNPRPLGNSRTARKKERSPGIAKRAGRRPGESFRSTCFTKDFLYLERCELCRSGSSLTTFVTNS